MWSSSNIVIAVVWCIIFGALRCSASDSTRIVYRVVFDTVSERSLASHWSGPVALTTDERSHVKMLGRFGSQAVTLTLNDLPPHARIRYTLEFYVIGSWDGVQDGDRLRMIVDGRDTVFQATFSNTVYRQSFPDSMGRALHRQRTTARLQNSLGFRFVEPGVYDGPLDAFYELRGICAHTSSTAVITFEGVLKDLRKGIENESWALRSCTIECTGIREFVQRRVPEADTTFQEDVFPGLLHSSDVVHSLRVPILVMECSACGPDCDPVTIAVYSDGTAAGWHAPRRRDHPEQTFTLTTDELDNIERAIEGCRQDSVALSYVYSTWSADTTTPSANRNCTVLLGFGDGARTVHVHEGYPTSADTLKRTVRAIFQRQGWTPTP